MILFPFPNSKVLFAIVVIPIIPCHTNFEYTISMRRIALLETDLIWLKDAKCEIFDLFDLNDFMSWSLNR
jgi:hypothetical protein